MQKRKTYSERKKFIIVVITAILIAITVSLLGCLLGYIVGTIEGSFPSKKNQQSAIIIQGSNSLKIITLELPEVPKINENIEEKPTIPMS